MSARLDHRLHSSHAPMHAHVPTEHVPFKRLTQHCPVRAPSPPPLRSRFSLNGAEQTGMLMEAATQLGLESVVRVCSAEELSAAAELKPTMIAIGDCTLLQADELLAAVPADMLAIADIPTPDVRGAWKVRDLGFAGLISGKSMMDVCVRDRVPPSAITKAILSKGSVKYGLGMQKGRLEGSKETLGSISM